MIVRRTLPALRPWTLADGKALAPGATLTPRQVQANIRRLVIEITWYGILVGTTINLLQVYVVRLGASSVLVGAVTYGPALVNVFWQVPAAEWMRHAGHRMRFVLGSGLLHRFGFLVVATLPLLIPMSQGLVEVTVALLVLQAFATALSATSFMAMMADAVPPDQVAQTVSWRMAGFGLTSTLSTLLGGLLLARLPFPLNYQLLFLIGFLASLASQWNVAQVVVPERAAVPAAADPWRKRIAGILGVPRFASFLGIVGALQMSIGMVAPLMPLYALRLLGASDAQVSLVITTTSATSVVGSLFMRNVVRRAGRELVLAGGILGYMLYPLLLSLAPSIGWVIPCAAIGGFFSAALAVTLFDNLLWLCPNGDKTSFVAVYNVCVNIALFGGPLLAGLIAGGVGGPALGLQVSAGLCAAAVLLALAWKRGAPQPDAA